MWSSCIVLRRIHQGDYANCWSCQNWEAYRWCLTGLKSAINPDLTDSEEVGHGICHEIIIDFLSCNEWTIVDSYCMSVYNEHSKASVIAGLSCRKLWRYKDIQWLCLVWKALIVDSWSALVAYLKCYYFLSCCSWGLQNLEGLSL